MAKPREAMCRRRKQLGYTQEAIAEALGVAVTTYRQWERGIATPRVGFRPRIARRLEVSLLEVDRWFDDDTVHTGPPDGMTVPTWLGHYASLEQWAASIWSFEAIVMPGLLQTADYARAVIRVTPEPITDEDITRMVNLRLARQAVLSRVHDPLALSVVIDESVLHRVAGTKAIMAAQLRHLAEAAAQPRIDVRVLPLQAGAFPFGNFSILTSPGAGVPYMACVEDRAGMHYLDRRHEIEMHARLFEQLQTLALAPGDSLELIRTVAEEHFA